MNNISLMNYDDIVEIYNIAKISLKEAWDLDSLKKEFDNNFAKYIVIKENNKVVGFVGLWIVLDEGQITNIAIHPNYRNRGLGKELLNFLISKMITFNITSISLEVRQSNIIAQKLYTKCGFKKCGHRKNFYTVYDQNNNKIGKEDAIIMIYS